MPNQNPSAKVLPFKRPAVGARSTGPTEGAGGDGPKSVLKWDFGVVLTLSAIVASIALAIFTIVRVVPIAGGVARQTPHTALIAH